MKVAVIGSRGQLGAELCRQLGAAAVGLDRASLDITDRAAVFRALARVAPDAVINAAAYTFVDQAEENAEHCERVNATGVTHLAEACRQLDCVLAQISTDYVFGGALAPRAPHREDEPASAQGVYARTKLAGERAALAWPRHFVVRTCGLYGRRPEGQSAGNFVDTMLRLGRERDSLRVVNDQHCTPSHAADVARAIVFLLTTSAYGVYHVVNGGSTTWFDFAAEIFRQTGRTIRLEPITTEQYGARAPRPRYSVLDTSKYHALGGPELPHWTSALSNYLKCCPEMG